MKPDKETADALETLNKRRESSRIRIETVENTELVDENGNDKRRESSRIRIETF